jgi:hypothetical protein
VTDVCGFIRIDVGVLDDDFFFFGREFSSIKCMELAGEEIFSI